MVSAKLSVSVTSLSDLLTRYIATPRSISDLASIWTPEFQEDYSRVKCQLEKLQKICQNYPLLSVKFCAAHTDPKNAADDLLTEALRLLEIAEQFQKGTHVSPQTSSESPLFPSDFGVTSSESGHLPDNETVPQPTILICCECGDGPASQLLSSLLEIFSRHQRRCDLIGVVFTSKSSRPPYLKTHIPIIFINHQKFTSEPTFPYFSSTEEPTILHAKSVKFEELYDCIAWSVHLLAQTGTSIAKSSKSSYMALRCRPSQIKGLISDYAYGIDRPRRDLDPYHLWWSALALFWIAFAERKIDGTELMSALATGGQDHFPAHSNLFAGRLRDAGDPSEAELAAILRESLITSEDGRVLLSSEEAKPALLRLVPDPGGIDEASIHEMIAHTCLRCIERHQPASILRPWTAIESYVDHQSRSSNLLLYAASHWYIHFRLGEQRSRRLSALLHQIIQSALSTDKINSRSHFLDSVQVIDVGMWLCAFYDFKFLGRTYLEMGAELTGVSGADTYPLHVAASKASLGVLELLLARQPKLNATDREGMTPLQVAVSHGHAAIVEMLLAAGSNVNDTFIASRATALHIAVHGGYEKIVSLLLKRGAEIDAKNALSESPLYVALRTGKLAIAKMLVDKGASCEHFSAIDGSIAETIYALRALSFAGRDASARECPQYVVQESARLEIHLRYF